MSKLTGLVIVLLSLSNAAATLRIVSYNCENRPNNTTHDARFRTIFEAIGNESVNGLAKRLDILVMTETDTDSAVRLTNVLNNLYNVTTYTSQTTSSVGGDRSGVIYDADTVELVGTATELPDIGTRPSLRLQFRPVGSTAPNERFYIYTAHLKSGNGSSQRQKRADEAANIRSDADDLGQGIPIIYAGDFNLFRSAEQAWDNMLDDGNGQAFDPLDRPGNWHDEAVFAQIHSQDPGGAMDDRFDFQFITAELFDGAGIDYVPDSYHVFGNDGSHTLNRRITTGCGAAPNVLTALAAASDHLPVVADYAVVEERTREQILERIAELEREIERLRDMLD
jgi:hypothetical protein